MALVTTAPLDDPTYVPAHPPVDGRVPAVVARWGANSQLRWFARFRDELRHMPEAEWRPFYCSSESHRGVCCSSCLTEQDAGFFNTDLCCCRAERPS